MMIDFCGYFFVGFICFLVGVIWGKTEVSKAFKKKDKIKPPYGVAYKSDLDKNGVVLICHDIELRKCEDCKAFQLFQKEGKNDTKKIY
jgi:hypothetical protein